MPKIPAHSAPYMAIWLSVKQLIDQSMISLLYGAQVIKMAKSPVPKLALLNRMVQNFRGFLRFALDLVRCSLFCTLPCVRSNF